MAVLLLMILASSYLSGVRSEPDTKTRLMVTNQIFTMGNSLELVCENACDDTGDIIECQIKVEGKCVTRNHLVCTRTGASDGCEWKAISSACSAADGESTCREAFAMKTDVGAAGGDRRPKPAVSYRLSSLSRRDLTGNNRPILESRSSMVSTSGNGHAYAYDGNNLAESHFGGRPVFTSILPGNRPSLGDLFDYPFSVFTRNSKDSPDVNPQENQFKPYSYQPPYAYTANYGYGANDVQQNISPRPFFGFPGTSPGFAWDKPRQSNPFAGVFQSVGLQDPMEMLQFFPFML